MHGKIPRRWIAGHVRFRNMNSWIHSSSLKRHTAGNETLAPYSSTECFQLHHISPCSISGEKPRWWSSMLRIRWMVDLSWPVDLKEVQILHWWRKERMTKVLRSSAATCGRHFLNHWVLLSPFAQFVCNCNYMYCKLRTDLLPDMSIHFWFRLSEKHWEVLNSPKQRFEYDLAQLTAWRFSAPKCTLNALETLLASCLLVIAFLDHSSGVKPKVNMKTIKIYQHLIL